MRIWNGFKAILAFMRVQEIEVVEKWGPHPVKCNCKNAFGQIHSEFGKCFWWCCEFRCYMIAVAYHKTYVRYNSSTVQFYGILKWSNVITFLKKQQIVLRPAILFLVLDDVETTVMNVLSKLNNLCWALVYSAPRILCDVHSTTLPSSIFAYKPRLDKFGFQRELALLLFAERTKFVLNSLKISQL